MRPRPRCGESGRKWRKMMNVSDLVKALDLKVVSKTTEKEVSGCYIGDLLSLAMSKVASGNVWITIQTNINVAAVASLTDAACVIIADGITPTRQRCKRPRRRTLFCCRRKKAPISLPAA